MNNRYNVIFLGAGAPKHGKALPALYNINASTRLLDWLLVAYNGLNVANFVFVAGYGYEELPKNYPGISYRLNTQWEKQGSLGSFLLATLPENKPVYVSYTDILYRPSVINEMEQTAGDVILAVDSNWKHRYQGRKASDLEQSEKLLINVAGEVVSSSADLSISEANAEFAGIIKLSNKAISYIKKKYDNPSAEITKKNIPFLIHDLIKDGLVVNYIDTRENFAELNAPEDLCQFILGTKAETLSRLRPMVKKSIIGDQLSFTIEEWNKAHLGIVSKIQDKFMSEALIVRSSAYTEDGWVSSNAGNFESILNVPRNEPEEIINAINVVINSYGDDESDHQVLVQQMLEDVSLSGVVFTRELTTGSPYYTFNYDAKTGSTESVTSGQSMHLETVTLSRNHLKEARIAYPSLWPALSAIQEIENLLDYDALDIEFAITTSNEVHIFQVRPIAVDHSSSSVTDIEIVQSLERSVQLFKGLQPSTNNILGNRAVFGVMPDWNPAEIIGTRPKPLATSLYRYLIMNDIWAKQRAEFGYKDVRPHPLLITFAGQPYVDIRASFNSFIPNSIGCKLTEKIVEHAINRLEKHPEYHDKIEFNILFTCSCFDFESKSQELLPRKIFTEDEVEQVRVALIEITQSGIDRIDSDISQVDKLSEKFHYVSESNISPLLKCTKLLNDCIEFGTLPFAHLARHGFIAITLLKSLESINLVSREEIDEFLNNVPSITGVFEADGAKVYAGKMDWEEFVNIYGHLRPGTYDITSNRYDADPEAYLRPMIKPLTDHKTSARSVAIETQNRSNEIELALQNIGLNISTKAFFDYCNKAIAGREIAKFKFTRSLSKALELIASVVEENGLTRHDAAFLSVDDFLFLSQSSTILHPATILKEKIELNKKEYYATSCIHLPSLLLKESDFFAFSQIDSAPNFVTTLTIIGEVAVLSPDNLDPDSIRGKIVMIESADPGFDWIFGYNIKGLITMYGGANSHMAIRTAELGIAAVIGAGDNLYQALSQHRLVEIDCNNKIVRHLS